MVVCVVIPAWKQGVACVEGKTLSRIFLLHSPGFFQRRSPPCPDTCFAERPAATSHQSWGHCMTIGEGNSVNFRWTSLILPTSLAPGHSLLGFPPGKQLWQSAPGWVPACSPLSPVCWGSQAWLWVSGIAGWDPAPVHLHGHDLSLVSKWGTRKLCTCPPLVYKWENLPLLLMANSLAFQWREHPAQEGKGHEQSCFKHLVSRAVAKNLW